MDFKNSVRILKKDWKTSVKRKEILAIMSIFPVIFTIIMPILMLIGVLVDPNAFMSEFGDPTLLRSILQIPAHYNDALAGAIMIIRMMVLPMFLFIPGMMPIVISSDSFAGEKERKTMEGVLLLPMTKTELILGKVLASFIPSMVISLTCFVALGIIINVMLISYLDGVILFFSDVPIMLVGLLLSPFWALLNIQISVIISSRAKDMKSAQSISGALITPVLGILLIQIFNPAFLTILTVLLLTVLIALLWLFFIYVSNKVLDPEKLILML
ncbi:MAG: ABC transporter permease subunit [Promethearchaeota archaeon]